MQVISHLKEIVSPVRKACLAIGMFDGVHLGHQQVIRQTVADAGQHEAASVVVTFDRHPNCIVSPANVPALIYSLPQKMRAIAALGTDMSLVIPFDETFSRQPPDRFIRELVAGFGHVQSICVGSAFAFGHRRSGNVEMLCALGKEIGFVVHSSSSVALDDQLVSSTRIRQAIQKGDLDAASQMLGRPYSLAGKIIRGAHLGRKLGFPTANLDWTGLCLPPNGVYASHATVKAREYRAVVNIGTRPTLGQTAASVQVEAHLLDFEGELYDQEMEIIFAERLRDEQRFADVRALQEQIQRDIAAARRLFG